MSTPRSLAIAALLVLAGCTVAGGGPHPKSDHYDGTVFRNAVDPSTLRTKGSFAIWWRFLVAKKEGTVPIDPIPVQPLDRRRLDALALDANHVVRLGHSSHLLKLRGRYWLIDPVFGERASPVTFAGPKRFHPTPIALEQLPPITGLILSHDHYDHLDREAIERLASQVERFFVPLGLGARLVEFGVRPDAIEELDWWQSARHSDVELTLTPAQHFSGRGLHDRDSTLWGSWVVASGSQRIFYSGDSGYFPGFKQIGERFGGFDLALIENGAYDAFWPGVHLTPEQSIQAFRDLRGKVLYGVHNSTFDLAFHAWREPMDRLADLAEKNGIVLATPVIGEVLTIGEPRLNQLWWKPLR